MPLDETSFIPLYHQLIEKLRENIGNREWPPGSLIPSEAELCDQYGVSRGTVRQALSWLVQQGFLRRKQGKGTFVAHPKVSQQLNRFYSVTQDIKGKGVKPFSEILQKTKILPDSNLRNILKLEDQEEVYKIVGLKRVDGEPFTLETSYLVEKLFPHLDELIEEEMVKAPFYDFIIEKCNVQLKGVEETFEPLLLDSFEAHHLKVPVDSAALLVKRITYTIDNMPFEFRRIVARGDNCRYSVKFFYGGGKLDLEI